MRIWSKSLHLGQLVTSWLAAAALAAGASVVVPTAATASGTTAFAIPQAAQVWVNSSSKVYHCPGTRYYGATKRGEYMTERQAQAAGVRPAGGRTCSPSLERGSGVNPILSALSGKRGVRVWVNMSSHVYHCSSSSYYGNTKRGAYMTETEAQAGGNRPAHGEGCGR